MTGPESADRAARAYREEAVLTAPRERLVHALLERAVRELGVLTDQLTAPDRASNADVGVRVTRIHDIVAELRAALDLDAGGELAENLDALYEFCLERLTRANTERDPAAARDATRILGELEEAWRDVTVS